MPTTGTVQTQQTRGQALQLSATRDGAFFSLMGFEENPSVMALKTLPAQQHTLRAF